MSKATKQVTLSAAFRRAAAEDEVGSLSYMLMSAFGMTLTACANIVGKALERGDKKIIVLMMAAGVQIRNNVVFVGKDFAGVQTVYPELVISGQADRSDIFNFSALHVCGHILAKVTSHPVGSKILKKAGDCTTGADVTTNEAGKINKEFADSWSSEEKVQAAIIMGALRKDFGDLLDKMVEEFVVAAPAFAKKLTAVQ